MCKVIFHIIFLALVTLGLLFTLVALFTPQWRQTTITNYGQGGQWKNATSNFGVSLTSCFNSQANMMNCTNWNNIPDYQKASIAFLAFAIIACGAAITWIIITWLACCCTSCNLWLLPGLAAAACLFDIIAVMCYGIGSGKDQMVVPENSGQMNSQSNIGYSMWLGIGAILTLFLAAIDGIILANMSKVGPMM